MGESKERDVTLVLLIGFIFLSYHVLHKHPLRRNTLILSHHILWIVVQLSPSHLHLRPPHLLSTSSLLLLVVKTVVVFKRDLGIRPHHPFDTSSCRPDQNLPLDTP